MLVFHKLQLFINYLLQLSILCGIVITETSKQQTKQEGTDMRYSEYKEEIKNIKTKEGLDNYIAKIADDETISARKYEALRCLAIKKFYEM